MIPQPTIVKIVVPIPPVAGRAESCESFRVKSPVATKFAVASVTLPKPSSISLPASLIE